MIVTNSFGKININAILIHELSHYALCNLNPNTACAPFDISKLRHLTSTADDLYGHHINYKASENSNEIKLFHDMKSDAKIFLKYEQAAKPVIIKAAQLLGLGEEKLSPYVLSKDFILYFKDNSLIDLFFKSPEFTLSQKKAFAQAYYQYNEEFYPDACPNKQWSFEDLKKYYEPCPEKISAEYIDLLRVSYPESFSKQVEFVKDYYFSYYKEKMNLTDNKLHFLERIADLVNREKDIYDIRSSYYHENAPKYSQYYVELIVRYPELIASGMDQDILDSFTGLAQFFDENFPQQYKFM